MQDRFDIPDDSGMIPQQQDGDRLPDDPSGKWTEIEHLPQWDEKYYLVYTAKKHGKWVMLKSLRPELQDNPAMGAMIEKEFDVRYNLAHPHIIMINDLDFVPGVGKSIITDDVYGDSLRHLIDTGKVDETILKKITTDLVDAMEYIQENHIMHQSLRPEVVIFTENIRNLKVIDVGFDRLKYLNPTDTKADISAFGKILNQTLDALTHDIASKYTHYRTIAEECQKHNCKYRSVQDLKMALNGRSDSKLLIYIIVFLAIMVCLLTWLNLWGPGLRGQRNVIEFINLNYKLFDSLWMWK